MRILDTDGTVLRDWRPRPDERANPEIDRGQLRDLLLGPLDVQWGRGVTRWCRGPGTAHWSISRTGDRRRSTSWSARTAPGPGSARRSRRDAALHRRHLGRDLPGRHRHPPPRPRPAGRRRFRGCLRREPRLVAQRNSGGHVKVYAQFRAPLDWHTDLDLADVEAVRSSLLALFDGWAAPVLDLLRHGTAFVHRPLYVLPVSHTWAHVPGVTLLGDAAHLMPPLGAGANLAMLEGAELAESIAAAPARRSGRGRPRLRGTDVGTGRQMGKDHDGRSGTPREPGPLRSPRPLRRGPAILTAKRESTQHQPPQSAYRAFMCNRSSETASASPLGTSIEHSLRLPTA